MQTHAATQTTPLLKTSDAGLPVYTHQPTPYCSRANRRSLLRRAWGLSAIYILTLATGTLLLRSMSSAAVQHTHPGIVVGGPDCGNPSRLVEAKNGAVATEIQTCSEMGVDVLQRLDGNAVDALVTATLCTGVVNMFSSGIGGGGFMTVRIPSSSPNGSSEVWSVDFRETAPAAAFETMFLGNPKAAQVGGLAVGVPGELRGLDEVHKRWGKVSWEKLVQPVADLARGWAIDRELARRMRHEDFVDHLANHPDWAPVFAPEGKLLQLGEIMRRDALANTLDAVAKGGADVFYKGYIAESIVRKVQSEGGILTLKDMEDYEVRVLPALSGTYHGREDYNVYTTHPPTSGGVMLHMLNLMERYDNLLDEGFTGLNAHRAVEAIKFGFAARTKVSDTGFFNNTEKMAAITTKEYANIIGHSLTDDQTHPPEYYHPEFDIFSDHGTSHTSIVDKDGMAVTLTSTVNLLFGSLVMDPVTGVLLNNEMDDFSIPGTPNHFGLFPSPYNYPAPHKRPLSSISPMIFERSSDNSLYLTIGGSGGSRIFPAVFHTILQLEWGRNLLEAVQHGRLHDQLFPMILETDSNSPVEVVEGLIHRGHNVTVIDVERMIAASVNAVIMERDGRKFAVSDPRKNGMAAGY